MADPSEQNIYAKTALNTVNRKKQRGVYDYNTIHTLVDSTPILHVAFSPPSPSSSDEPTFPAILPMLGCTSPLPSSSIFPTAENAAEDPPAEAEDALNQPRVIYLHGYVSSRLMRLPQSTQHEGEKKGEDGDGSKKDEDGGKEKGVPVTVSATNLDGIILALTPFVHSCNYRSAVVFGHATTVTDPAEKMHAMRLITNNLIPHRWSHTRVPPTAAELTSTGILRVEIHSASAKVHIGGPADDKKERSDEDVTSRVWTGVVPTWLEYGAPREGVYNKVEGVPGYLGAWLVEEREEKREVVEGSLRDEKGVLGVREAGEKGQEKKGWGVFGL